MRLDSIAFEADGFIELLSGKLGGSYERDLLHTFHVASAPDNLLHQGASDSFAARFRPHINAPNVALVTLFVVLTAEKTGCANKLAMFKHADNEVAGRIAFSKLLLCCFNCSLQMLFI